MIGHDKFPGMEITRQWCLVEAYYNIPIENECKLVRLKTMEDQWALLRPSLEHAHPY